MLLHFLLTAAIAFNTNVEPVRFAHNILSNEQVFSVPLYYTGPDQRPDRGVSNVVLSKREGQFAQVSFTAGNGNKRLIVGTKKTVIDFVPVDGVNYTGGYFGTGQLVAIDEFILSVGDFTSSMIEGLVYDSSYTVKIFEFDQNNGFPLYNTTEVASINIPSITTPEGNSKFNLIWGRESNLASYYLNLYFHEPAVNKNRLVVASLDHPVDFTPVQYQKYTQSDNWYDYFYQYTYEEYIILGAGNLNFLSLMPMFSGKQIYIKVFDYVGYESPVYNTDTFYDISFNTASVRWKLPPPADITDTIVQHPTIPPTQNGSIQVLDSTAGSVKLRLHPGNGVGRMLVARANDTVSWKPADSTYYSFSTQMGAVQPDPHHSILYRVGALEPVDITITNLSSGIPYQFALYEYNGVWENVYHIPVTPVDTGEVEPPLLTAPSIPATDFIYTQPDGKSAKFSFTKGDGSHRIIFAGKNENYNIDFNSINSLEANSNYGEGNEVEPGVYLVGLTTGEQFTLNNLDTSTSYYIKVYEVNIDTGNADHWLVLEENPLSFTVATLGLPDGDVRIKQWWIREGRLGNPTANIKLSPPAQNESRLILISLEEPSDWEPVQFQKYTVGDWYDYAYNPYDPDGVIAYIGKNTAISLQPFFNHKQVYVKIWELNGVDNPVYNLANYYKINFDAADLRVKENVLVDPTDTIIEPVYEAPSVKGSVKIRGVNGNEKQLTIFPGNGMGRVLLMSTDSVFNFIPNDGEYFHYNEVYGDVEIGTNEFAVYLSGGRDSTNINVRNIDPQATYYYALYEYNGMFEHVFNTVPYRYNEVAEPALASSSLIIESVECNAIKGYFNKGNGTGRLVIASKNLLNTYVLPGITDTLSAQPVFGSGTQVSEEAYIVAAGDIDSVWVEALNHSTTYYFTVVEYNLSNNEMIYAHQLLYQTAASTIHPPVLAVQLKEVQAEGQHIVLQLNAAAEGVKRLVVIGPPNNLPQQYLVYTGNNYYGAGDVINSSYVIYSGSDTTISITGLEPEESYEVQIFEYKGIQAPVYNLAQFVSETIHPSALLNQQLKVLPPVSNGNKVALSWEVIRIDLVEGFIIERTRPNSTIKENIAEIKAVNNVSTYGYTDFVSQAGEHTYQITVKWKNGDTNLSKIQKVQIAVAEGKLLLFPNPAVTHFKLSGIDQQAIKTIKLFNIEGKLVKEWKVSADNYYQLPAVTSKLYYIVVVTENKDYVQQLSTAQ
jgi:hypothetical protein